MVALDTPVTGEPVPVVDWDATDRQWLDARRVGLGASEVAAALGMSTWTTPWQVWADKTGVQPRGDERSDAAELGTALEPWILGQASVLLGEPVERTPARLYAHPQHPWRLASPDAHTKTGPLVEAKTAGLAGRADVSDWDDGVPLAYEIQCRWQMHVMDAPADHVVALVAGLGLIVRTVVRDLLVEEELVRQVTQWWDRYVTGSIEPPLGGGDLDALARRWPTGDGGVVDVDDTDAAALLGLRRSALARRNSGQSELDDIDAQLRGLIGGHGEAYLDNSLAYALSPRRGSIDWKAVATDLMDDPTAEVDPEDYRRPPTRTLKIAKEWQ